MQRKQFPPKFLEKRPRGRTKGVHNTMTRQVREAVRVAAELVGEDGKGKNGMTGYLVMLARKEPKVFAGLLGRLIPVEISGPGGGPVQVAHLDPSMLINASEQDLDVLERILAGRQAPKMIDASPDDYEAILAEGDSAGA